MKHAKPRGRPKGSGFPLGPQCDRTRAILLEYAEGQTSLRDLASKHGVSHQCVQQAIKRHAPELLKRNSKS